MNQKLEKIRNELAELKKMDEINIKNFCVKN